MKNSELRVCAIILAAGSGTRMGKETTKQRMEILGETVLKRCVSSFQRSECINEIIVVSKEDEIEYVKSELKSFDKVKKVIIGGKTRAESAKSGFFAVSSDVGFVAIHDAARCFVTPEVIETVVGDAFRYGAATASTFVTDTVKRINSDGFIEATVPRAELRAAQTPQVFSVELYRRALDARDVLSSEITDDNSLIEAIGVPVFCSTTDKNNIKITTAEDLPYAEFLAKERV